MTKKEISDKEKQLEGLIKKYVDIGDFFTAKNYVKSWGETIEGYPIDVKLQELEKLEEKMMNKKA